MSHFSKPFIKISNLNNLDLASDSYIIFGGSFDPIHQGHINAIKQLSKFFNRIILAVTEQNPWKENVEAPTSIRREIAASVIKYENLTLANNESEHGISISSKPYEYAEDLVKHYRSKLSGKLFWAVGEDIADSVAKWRNWNKLDVQTIIVPIEIPIHSTHIKQGSKPIHPGAVELVKQHKLYTHHDFKKL